MADDQRRTAETSEHHKPWHCVVQASATGGLGWCIDCLCTVFVEADGPNVLRGVPDSDGRDCG